MSLSITVPDLHLLTSRVVARTLPNFSCFFEIDVPTVGLAGSVGQHKGEDGVALLDGLIALHLAGTQRILDCVEGDRRRKVGYNNGLMSVSFNRGGKGSQIWLGASRGTNGSSETFWDTIGIRSVANSSKREGRRNVRCINPSYIFIREAG